MKLQTGIIKKNLPKDIGLKIYLNHSDITEQEQDEVIKIIRLFKEFRSRYPEDEFLTHTYPISNRIFIDFAFINTHNDILIGNYSETYKRKDYIKLIRRDLNIIS